MKTKQEKSIQVAQDNILAVAQQNQEYREQKIKQAQIDVLCKLKQYSYCDNLFADGKWHRYVMVNDIEKLIEELKNEN